MARCALWRLSRNFLRLLVLITRSSGSSQQNGWDILLILFITFLLYLVITIRTHILMANNIKLRLLLFTSCRYSKTERLDLDLGKASHVTIHLQDLIVSVTATCCNSALNDKSRHFHEVGTNLHHVSRNSGYFAKRPGAIRHIQFVYSVSIYSWILLEVPQVVETAAVMKLI